MVRYHKRNRLTFLADDLIGSVTGALLKWSILASSESVSHYCVIL